ncbi:MarR family transcriptional regulator [Sphingobium sp. SYK-6]|uniref:MarR family winged helix-turn-helix transcriptional regulator n=1 Tax=Sphingobium sp. (strain NBRC 103272 / SYK-6) TaxID=627192 RepID=UPI0002276A3B|nr:MarR family winged helix-turn-helix transcriptional regulator [Sphingobium sp. SYK-6]BAK65401.1 MarR family transcriptional regulator [Sphingobium sp. SYK-6]
MTEPLQDQSGAAETRAPDAGIGPGMNRGMLGESIGPTIRLLRNMLTTRIVAAFEPFGLRSGTFSTMALIAANPGCSQTEIAREIGTDKSIVVAIVDDLEKRGLAERQRSTQDRRRNALRLTGAGEAVMADLAALGRQIEQPIRAALSEAEVTQLITLSRRAVDALMADG